MVAEGEANSGNCEFGLLAVMRVRAILSGWRGKANIRRGVARGQKEGIKIVIAIKNKSRF